MTEGQSGSSSTSAGYSFWSTVIYKVICIKILHANNIFCRFGLTLTVFHAHLLQMVINILTLAWWTNKDSLQLMTSFHLPVQMSYFRTILLICMDLKKQWRIPQLFIESLRTFSKSLFLLQKGIWCYRKYHPKEVLLMEAITTGRYNLISDVSVSNT